VFKTVVDRRWAIQDGVWGGVVDHVLPHRVPTHRTCRGRVFLFGAIRPNRGRTENVRELAVNPGCTPNESPIVVWGLLRRIHGPMVRPI
jgi:hypothetical protein